jgi:hypothetical protein
MPIRAENDPRYSRRFLLMGLAAIGFALWFLYDGVIRYPNKRERAFSDFRLEFKQLFDGNPGQAELNVEAFEAQANEEQRHRWDEYLEHREMPSANDLIVQFVMAGIVAVVALLLLSIPWRARGRWIEASDTGIASSWGQSFHYDQVLELNKRQWRGKGIAKVTYHDGRRKRRFVIDDYKFERYPTDEILYELEQRIGPEKITGGPPEPPPEETPDSTAESRPEA